MASQDYEALLSRIDERELVRVCQDLIRLETANPPGNERQAALYVADYLGRAGFNVDLLDYEPERTSVVARLPAADRDRGALMLNGHLDVVPAGAHGWSHAPFGAELAGNRIWGRGSSDMKSGVAALLVAAAAAGRAGLPLRADLLVTATAGEEAGMGGAQAVAAWPGLGDVAAVLIAEPTNNTLGLAERGALWLELVTTGKTAHASTPHLGRNAITMMRRLLDEFERLEIPYAPHPLLGNFTYSIDMISGGSASNVVPERCAANIDLRTVPGQQHAAILEQVQSLIDRLAAADPGFSAAVHVEFDLPAVDTPADHPAVATFNQAVRAVTGYPARQDTVRFATEAAVFVPALHVPAIIYGPGDPAMAHQPDEYVEIEHMLEAARVYAAAIAEFSLRPDVAPAAA